MPQLTRPRRWKKGDIGECVYCGEQRPLNTDHIPPQGLWAKPKPTDLIYVPSCDQCNGGSSKDDDYLKTTFAILAKGGDHPEAIALRPSIERSFQYPEAKGRRQAFLGSLQPVLAMTSEGALREVGLSYYADVTRIDRVVTRITRGLYWHHYEERLPTNTEVLTYTAARLERLEPAVRLNLHDQLVVPILNREPHSLGRGVFRYWRSDAAERRRYATAWIYEFYDDARCLAVTLPATFHAAHRIRDPQWHPPRR